MRPRAKGVYRIEIAILLIAISCAHLSFRTGTFFRLLTTSSHAHDSVFYSLRGKGERVAVVLMDEFMFMAQSVYASIFPTIITGALLCMISSMSPGNTAAKDLMHVKADDGSDIITKYNWLQV